MKLRLAGVYLGLLLLTVWVFARVVGFDYVGLDDDRYIYDNTRVLAGLSGDNVRWAFTTIFHSNWHPLTWLSYMVDTDLFGADPATYHATNLVLHVANALLLFGVLVQMTGGLWPSAFTAALFAVHPLHVESVAWISERKDVLSTFFWIATMGAYTAWTRRGGGARYGAVVALFSLGLMAKPMLVTLPFALLLLDYWPLRRWSAGVWRSRVVEKLPLVALAVLSAAVTVLAQARSEALSSLELMAFHVRVANACSSYALYVWKTLWPVDLAILYPLRFVDFRLVAFGGVLLALGTRVAFVLRDRHPYLAVGWLWYLGTLLPVIGIVQVGAQQLADRYTYVPLIGPFVAAAWLARAWVGEQRTRRNAVVACACVLVAVAALRARDQVEVWQDTFSLFEHSIAVTGGQPTVHYNLGRAYESATPPQMTRAIEHYRAALALSPRHPRAWIALDQALDRER